METYPKIIGREREIALLEECVNSAKPEFVAVYGRRRIGKTFLIKQFFKNQFDFYMTGAYGGSMKEMLDIFNHQLKEYSNKEWPMAKSWVEAFRQLQEYLSSLRKKTVVVFIDELPWFDTPRARFLQALELFWNSWGDSRSGLKFIVCGSSTTWMTNELLRDKGGLHNRVNRRLYLPPFNLYETEKMLIQNGINWSRHQVAECYMIVGGTPFYLAKMNRSLSLAQNVDRLFFSNTGELREEYDILFRSLFKNSSVYKRVVELLATKSAGMTRDEIAAAVDFSNGGKLTETLQNLETCDFIRNYKSFGNRSKGRLYQLTDLFTLFYLKRVKDADPDDDTHWKNRIDDPSHRAWSGYAFEQLCLHHIPQIKAALGIAGVATSVSAWVGEKGGKRIGQIDLVIDRRDEVVNLCEMKYSLGEYTITPDYIKKMIERRELFRSTTKTRKALHLTMITVNGLKRNAQQGMIQNEVTADQLFAKTP